MTDYSIAVVGAGAVGQEMLRVLAERQFLALPVQTARGKYAGASFV